MVKWGKEKNKGELMGDKDKAEKQLEDYADIFADIVNGLLFGGDQVIRPEQLVDALPRSVYKADEKMHDQERDTVKFWQNGQIRISVIGLENQTNPDPDMPLRVISYDGAAYRAEMLRDEKDKKAERYPVVTLVLYYGYKNHWDKPQNLKNCFSIPERLAPYVSDYKINLFEIAWLTDEQVKLFHSDFRIVADFFVQMRKNHEYKAVPGTIQHVKEVLELMKVLTGDDRFMEVYNESMEGGHTSMIDVFDKVLEQGREQGIEQGVDRGKLESIYMLMEKQHLSFDDAADLLCKDKNEKERLRNVMSKTA